MWGGCVRAFNHGGANGHLGSDSDRCYLPYYHSPGTMIINSDSNHPIYSRLSPLHYLRSEKQMQVFPPFSRGSGGYSGNSKGDETPLQWWWTRVAITPCRNAVGARVARAVSSSGGQDGSQCGLERINPPKRG